MSLLWDDKEEEQSSACYTTGDRLLLLLAHRQDGPLGEEREQGREEEDPWRGDSGGKEEWHHDARFLLLFLFLLWWLKSSYRHLPELSPESEGPGRGLVLHSGHEVWARRRFPPLSYARSKVSRMRSPEPQLFVGGRTNRSSSRMAEYGMGRKMMLMRSSEGNALRHEKQF